jgi:two-component system sensor histidine kinase UhpB
MVDITDLKVTERKLISSLQREKYLADIIRETGVALCIGYIDGTIGIHNTAFRDLIGYSEEELKRISWDIGLTPPEWREVEKQKLNELASSGREVRYQKEYLHKSGLRIPVELVVHPSFDDTGRLSHYFAFITDITERKQAEAELIKSQGQFRKFSIYLQEKIEEERKWLSNEIHDELGQILTGLKIDLSWLSRKLPPDADFLNQKSKAMLDLIDEADKVVKRIAEDLRPVLLDDLGLIEAIGWMVAQFQNRTGITTQFNCTSGPISINKDLAMDIFRIVQEAITNVSRHAEATRVRISFKKNDGQFVLSIKDNGKGVKSEDVTDIKSFGLLGMKERARRWDGTLKIHGIPGKGTTILLIIPVEVEENG